MSESLRTCIEELPFIDTHSHAAGFDAGTPVDDRGGKSLPQLLMNDYLLYLAGSCGEVPRRADGAPWGVEDAEEHFRALQPLLAQYRGLTTYAALREGIRELHPFEAEDITLENWRAVNDSVVAAYRTHGERAWHREVCRRAGIVEQTQICELAYVADHWEALAAEERERQAALLLPSMVLDGFFFSGLAQAAQAHARARKLVGMCPATYREHLAFCEAALDLFVQRGGASVKMLAAYVRPLRFQDVPDAVAEPLFDRGAERLTGDDLRRLQDNLCWHLLRMVAKRGLPLIVHTGYSVPTDWGDPEHLHNLFAAPELEGLKIDLAHAGWPHHAGALLMARTYRHCYFNLCWTPLLSAALGRQLLSLAIDVTPRNKILLGTDCGSPESMLGAVRLLRRVLGEVLMEKVAAGQFSIATARDYARALLYENPRDFYGPFVLDRLQAPHCDLS